MKTVNAHTHRIRHRRRFAVAHPNFSARHRKRLAHLTQVAGEMNAIVGVAGVTTEECLTSIRDNVTINPAGVRDIRARDQRGTTLVAEVEALGIPIA